MSTSSIHQRLKFLRNKKGLSIKEVSSLIGVSPSTYREWELGTKISGEPYLKLCEVFNVSIYFLLIGEEKSNNITRIIENLDNVIITLTETKKNVISPF